MSGKIKAKINLEFDNQLAEPTISFESSIILDNKSNYEILIRINPNQNFLNYLILNDNLRQIIEDNIAINDCLKNDFPELTNINNILNDILNNKINIIDTIDTIEFDSECQHLDILNYLHNNKILQNKTIIIGDFFSLNDISKIKAVAHEFKDYPKLKIKLEGNIEAINIEEAIKTINAIDSIVGRIKKYNFSPLEQIMYTYDLVRNRVYSEETEKDSWTMSRDLSKALLGDKIVCLGYAEIFHCILKNLGINDTIWKLNGLSKLFGHARNAVYINDTKYDIQGIYFFDPTWDSKQKEKDKDYLSSYRFFAKTRKDFAKIDKNNNLIDNTFPIYTLEENLKYVNYIANDIYDKVPIQYIKMIKRIAELTDNDSVDIPYLSILYFDRTYLPKDIKIDKKITSVLFDYAFLLNEPISTDILIKALLNVRKIEYYENPEKYPFSLVEFNQIYLKSLWSVSKNVKNIDEYSQEIANEMAEMDELYALDKQINQVKLTKTLRKIYEKKKDANH